MNDFYSLLGKIGIFQRSIRGDDWEVEIGTLKRVTKIGDSYVYTNTENNVFDQFIQITPEFNQTQQKNNDTVDSSVIKKEVSDKEFLNDVLKILPTPKKKETDKKVAFKKSNDENSVLIKSVFNISEGKKVKCRVNNPNSKYIGTFGIMYNDSDIEYERDGTHIKGVNGFGMRLDYLFNIVERNGKIKYVSRKKCNDYIYYKEYDNFRPVLKREFENEKIGIGFNVGSKKQSTPRLSLYRYKVDNKFKVSLYKCSLSFYCRDLDYFFSLKELSEYIPIAVSEY